MLGVNALRGARTAAHVAVAENNLRQVSVALDLYFHKYLSFPRQGSDLVAALSPFLGDPRVLANPLRDERTPGQSLSLLYHAPSLAEVDCPNCYVTAFVSEDGSTAVILKTGGIVERRDGLHLPADNLLQAAAALAQQWTHYSASAPEPETDLGFDVTPGGDVVTRTCSDVRVKALGSQFGYADGTLVSIKVTAQITGGWLDPFGSQSVQGGESYLQPSVKAGTHVTLRAEITDPYTRQLFTRHGYPLSYTSNDTTGQVVVLRRGDLPMSNKPGYPYQVGVATLLASCVGSDGCVAIAPNEALYCFDFNPLRTGFGIDFNDLVVLATAVAAEQPCEED